MDFGVRGIGGEGEIKLFPPPDRRLTTVSWANGQMGDDFMTGRATGRGS